MYSDSCQAMLFCQLYCTQSNTVDCNAKWKCHYPRKLIEQQHDGGSLIKKEQKLSALSALNTKLSHENKCHYSQKSFMLKKS